ncbi:MAG: DNA repair protein RadC [Pseudomonadota bacterium]
MNPAQSYSSMSDTELLRRLIGSNQARKLYRGSLTPLFAESHDRGTPPEKCLVARELVKRFIGENLHVGCVLTQPENARDFLQVHFAGQEYESFVTLYLDSMHRLITAEELFRGSLSETAVYPREIVKTALKLNAGAVIFAHNHPHGGYKPSQPDKAITKMLTQALVLIDVEVLDHYIVAPASTYSMSERRRF